MRAADLSPDRRKLLIAVHGRQNVKALVPPSCPRTLEVVPILDQLMAAERAIARTTVVARLLPPRTLLRAAWSAGKRCSAARSRAQGPT